MVGPGQQGRWRDCLLRFLLNRRGRREGPLGTAVPPRWVRPADVPGDFPNIALRACPQYLAFSMGIVLMIVVRWHSLFLAVFGSLGLAIYPGCGDGKPYTDTSLSEATVTGVVSVKGVPATGGTVLFNPSNSGRIVPTRTAPIGPDGTYTITTYTGVNQVSFGGEVAAKNRGVGLLKDFAEVTSGVNKKDFDLFGENSGKKLQFPVEGGGAEKGGAKRSRGK